MDVCKVFSAVRGSEGRLEMLVAVKKSKKQLRDEASVSGSRKGLGKGYGKNNNVGGSSRSDSSPLWMRVG